MKILEKVEGPVGDLLRKHEAEAAYHVIRELLQECFPEITSLEVRAEPDWNDPRWLRVVFDPMLPPGYPIELLERQFHKFDERLLEKVPPSLAMLFVVNKNYPAEASCGGTNS